ncbi:MAG: tyrosine-type recombinase/integrase [Methanosarcina sp.]
MKVTKLRENPFVSEWLDNLNASANTEDTYLQGMQAYLNFTQMTPEELIHEAEEEIVKGILPRHRQIKKHLIGFRKHLQNKDLADFSVRSRLTGVRSFYISFEIELPKLQGEGRHAKVIEDNSLVPTKAELQEVLRVCDPLERSILLVGVSSGLASNELRSLKVKQFRDGYDSVTGITTLKLVREKTNVAFCTFLSAEATKAVNEYLDFRNRDIKAATARRKQQLEKQRIVGNDGYLFILRQVPPKYIKTGDEELRKLTENAVQKLYRAISDKAQKNTKEGCYNVIRSHTMRKYFNSVLLNNGCDSFHTEFFMGHKLDQTRSAYFLASPDKLREIYKQYMPFLTIQKELDISESPEYLAIKKENEILRAETERHVVTRHDFQDIRDAINSLVVQTPPLGPDATVAEKERHANRKKLEERATALQDSMKKIFHIE